MTTTELLNGFLARTKSDPAAPALRTRKGVVSYGELAALAGHAQAELTTLPPGPVAVLAKKSPEAIALVLACLAAGRPVLLPPIDLGAVALRELCERAGCAQVLATDPEQAAEHPGLVTRVIAGADGPALPQPAPVTAAHTAFILTTSGSTGTPKLVPLSAGAVSGFTGWAGDAFGLGPGEVVLNYAPLNFDLCLLDIWATLRHGGCVALVDPAVAANPRHVGDFFAACDVTVVQGVPMLYQLLAEGAFPGVRHVIVTGDHAPASVRATLPDRFPNARYYNVYGCTETNDSFWYEFDAAEAAAPGPLPIGEPLPGVVAVLERPSDPERADAAELLVRTPFQTTGYLTAEPGASNGRFVTGADGHAYFRTGDLVRRDPGGRLFLVGRDDFQLKVRGVRVNPEQIERVLLEHDDVVEAVVVPDGEGADVRLTAFVRRTRTSGLSGLRLRAHCATRLPRAAIPSAIRLVEHPFPRTSTGKVDRKRIAA
ncbi:D-alanine--poly(phosphoribitol) ligase [Nonomuraea sp. PA05]|uniref:AMP-binding protein n=1 Tax=Nonomuraea sp. PA05 TaxID=2604466 RepID=UPI0011D9C157|nr:AMP-binding protein [Nonomuraea sp. PA05]TYB71332.1 D-alanine--poly(phosphoribitol) ligase [Nonomuraea sp. PA05]